MTKFLSCGELYETIQQKSLETKKVLWVCSPILGLDAHKIFSQEILKNPPEDIRFIFKVNDSAVKSGETDPYEIQYFMEHFNGSCFRSYDAFNSQIYIFDDSALVTSANLAKSSFECNMEAGVLLDGAQVDEVKSFFSSSLWENAKPVTEVKKYKKLWNQAKKNRVAIDSNKHKAHTKIREWTDYYTNKWYFSIPDKMNSKVERKIKKETNWAPDLKLVADIGPTSFKQLKLGDLAFIANLTKKKGKIDIELGQVFDKSKVETDEGDLHFAYEVKKIYLMERNRFYQLLQDLSISQKSWAVLLNQDQATMMTNILSPTKPKKKNKA